MKKNFPNKFPDDIIDMKFFGNQAYVLKEINLTSTQVEEQLKKLKYSGQNRKKLKNKLVSIPIRIEENFIRPKRNIDKIILFVF